jgi:small subunit ribosomal protein S16
MVKIRLARGGRRGLPYYFIVVTDSRARRDSNFIEILGFYNPVATGKSLNFKVNSDKLSQWVANGAQLSDRVNSLLKKHRAKSVEAVG